MVYGSSPLGSPASTTAVTAWVRDPHSPFNQLPTACRGKVARYNSRSASLRSSSRSVHGGNAGTDAVGADAEVGAAYGIDFVALVSPTEVYSFGRDLPMSRKAYQISPPLTSFTPR